MIFRTRFQATIALVLLAVVAATLGAVIAAFTPIVVLTDPNDWPPWLIFIAIYFAFAGLSAGVALSLHKLPKTRLDRVESRVPGTFYDRCPICRTHFIRLVTGERLQVLNPDLPKEAATL